MMILFFFLVSILLIIVSSFKLGMRWEAKVIYDELINKGNVTTQWGDSDKTVFTIIGSVE